MLLFWACRAPSRASWRRVWGARELSRSLAFAGPNSRAAGHAGAGGAACGRPAGSCQPDQERRAPAACLRPARRGRAADAVPEDGAGRPICSLHAAGKPGGFLRAGTACWHPPQARAQPKFGLPCDSPARQAPVAWRPACAGRVHERARLPPELLSKSSGLSVPCHGHSCLHSTGHLPRA